MGDKTREIYLVRHGHIQKDREKSYVGQKDYPLSELGMGQAEALGRDLAMVPFARIISSDLNRTRATAARIAEHQSAPVETTPLFREVSLGLWEGLTFSEVMARFPEEYEQRGRDLAGHRPSGGENFRDLSQRVIPAFEQTTSETDGPLLIVTHNGVIRVILCHILGLPLERMFVLSPDYGSFSRVRRMEDGFRLILFNSSGVDFYGEQST